MAAPRLLSMITTIPRSTMSALTRYGYEFVHDIDGLSPDALSQNLKICLEDAELLLSLVSRRANSTQQQVSSSRFPLSQSVSSMVNEPVPKYSTMHPSIDKLLSGTGLPRGHILEIAGPPGCIKESLAINIVHSCVHAGEEVLFVDSQNMSSFQAIKNILSEHDPLTKCNTLITHVNIHSLASLLIFMHTLPQYLDSHPEIKMLVLNSLSFLFQETNTMSFITKNNVSEQLKQALSHICTTRNITVVITSQTATKFINLDGSPGTFDTGGRAIMVPYIGNAYLPSGRTYRLIVIPREKNVGVVRLKFSPSYRAGPGSPIFEAPYGPAS